ncbi:uncharacterized protein MYCFIDRAFT_195697 [Pseudocercospora fijiensis CIRAD86]|uniref:F-box domain-containing protein n=1 Tax=Pseudocercospora fijiensis (strain CIRAD86) TaxID=383855 RepID=M3A0P1_PSEFD|nr:uncharacterized protein MYCFIDRAFT_195697 [Pseudocercospora fijiensis CIRAD86]EME84714.1 hypothetical protein MYCFIDRAFT_195697 [Pseudocercospora fijiensis CIRAD86]
MAKLKQSRGKRPRSPALANANKKRRTRNTDIPARNAVFATTELLENILLHLPSKAIAKSQMVCRKFRDVVEESPLLQIQIFNQPVPEARHNRTPWAVRISRTQTSRRRAPCTPRYDHRLQLVLVREKPVTGLGLAYICYKEVEMNWAIFKRRDHPAGWSYRRLHDLEHHRGEEVTFTPESTHSLSRSLHGEVQSWERSYLCNPPCTRASISIVIKIGPRKALEQVKLRVDAWAERKEGLTFGYLLDAALSKKAATDEFDYDIVLTENYEENDQPAFDGCVRDFVSSLETKHKTKAWISAEDCLIRVSGIILPTDEDSKDVVEIGAELRGKDDQGEAGWWQTQMEEYFGPALENGEAVSADGSN